MRAVGKDEKLLQILLLEYKETIKLGFTAILWIDCKLFALLFITQYVHLMILVLTGGADSKINHQISGFTYGAKTSRSSSSSGSDWASNTSSNPDLNNSDHSDPKRSGKPNISSINGLSTHQELTTATSYGANDLNTNGSRPNSRQRKKRDVNKNLSGNSQSDQLLPAFYENVSSIQSRQKLLGKLSK